MKCKCGEWISNNNKDIQYLVYSDDEWNRNIDRNEAGEKLLDIGLSSIIFWKCPKCNRLHFFKDNLNNVVSVYRLEEE